MGEGILVTYGSVGGGNLETSEILFSFHDESYSGSGDDKRLLNKMNRITSNQECSQFNVKKLLSLNIFEQRQCISFLNS